jgi:hypothetical protein
MSDPVTIDDIYQLFRVSTEEFDRRIAEAKIEADRRAAEADRSLARLERTVEPAVR